MKKAYFLQTCDTCRRILKEVNLVGFELQELKTTPINETQLAEMYAMTNSYEALFNRRAQRYRLLDLKSKHLSEADYKKYILQEYTFLKRPVFIVDDEIFVGNSKKVIQHLKNKVGS